MLRDLHEPKPFERRRESIYNRTGGNRATVRSAKIVYLVEVEKSTVNGYHLPPKDAF